MYRSKNTGKYSKQPTVANFLTFVGGITIIYLGLLYAIPRPVAKEVVQMAISPVQASEVPVLEAPAPCTLKDVICPNEYDPTTDTQKTKTLPASIKNHPVAIQIYAIAKEENFKWGDYAVRLAFAESSLNPKAINKNTNGTTDRGLFQWNSIHKQITDACAFSIDCATRTAFRYINDGKQGIWVADKKVKGQKFE